MSDLSTRLAHKGWTRADINKAAHILAHAESSKTASMKFFEQLTSWVGLFLAVLGNFLVSVVIVPFLLLLEGFSLYATIFVIGVVFGTLVNVLIGYIENLGGGHKIIAGAFIPALALINIYLITYFTNDLERLLQLATAPHSPALVSVTYVIAFTIPYLLEHFDHVRKRQL